MRTRFVEISQPERFTGELRPYQITGLSWLHFLDRFGLAACLADDMGLGKTVQLIALLQDDERSRLPEGRTLAPTLLAVPTSVGQLGAGAGTAGAGVDRARAARSRRGRPSGDEFTDCVQDADVVITTYALVVRDNDTLGSIDWHRVVLDERSSTSRTRRPSRPRPSVR